jgi:hypothetical protein
VYRTIPDAQVRRLKSGECSSIGLTFREKAEDSRKTPRREGRESHT